LKRVGEAGGDAQVLCDAPFTSNGTWGAAGAILIEDKYRIARVPEAGGPPVPLELKLPQACNQLWPQFLPDGRHFLFLCNRQDDATLDVSEHLYAGSLDGPDAKIVTRDGSRPAFAAPGFLFFVRDPTL